MRRASIYIALLIVIASIALYVRPNEAPVAPVPVPFLEIGFLSNHDPSLINNALYLVYEKPGAPALSKRLEFDESSVCRSGRNELPCIAINQTIFGAFQNKRVFVEGTDRGSTVLVQTLREDIEADRKFGFMRSVRKNGENYLVELDEIEFLSGDTAIQAGVADTKCAPEQITECIPSLNNDFYIRNLSTTTEIYNLTDESRISMFANPGSPVLKSASRDEFALIYTSPKQYQSPYPWMYILEGATIKILEEQYLP